MFQLYDKINSIVSIYIYTCATSSITHEKVSQHTGLYF